MTQTAAQFLTATLTAGETPKPFSAPGYWAGVAKAESIPFGRKGYGAGQTDCCAFCGKLALGATFHAYLTGAGEFTTPPESEDTLTDDLGFYPLGADCAQRLRKHVPVFGAAPDYTRA